MIYTWSNKRMWLCGIVDLDSRVIGSGTITNSKKSSKGSRVDIGSMLGPNQRNEIHILFSSMECDYPKMMIQFLDLWVWK